MTTTREPFDVLLTWLHPGDREAAGRAYEVIRSGLINVLVSKGFSNAEDLADEAIRRVTKRVPEIAPNYQGEPVKYFHGVLRNIIREQHPNHEPFTDQYPEKLDKLQNTSRAYDCLISCLERLPDKKSEFILDYYTYQGGDKIRSHQQMAEEMELSENALRMKAYHIRQKLGKCVRECLRKSEMKLPRSPIEHDIGQRKTEPRA